MIDIRQLVNLPPEDAIAFLDAKGYRTSVNWTDTWEDEHTSAFTVAKVARIDLLREIHVSLIDAMATGQTFDSWQTELKPRLQAAGWWGKIVDPDLTGTDQPVLIGPRRLRTIYDTNLRMARATALWGRIWAAREQLPFLRYSAVMDRRTRPQHRLWHDIVLPVEHPFWQTHFPPNGWNCRCTVVQLSARALERRGLAITSEAELARRGVGAAPVPFWRKGSDGEPGRMELVPRGIDPGFAYNPGTARARLVLEKAADSLARAASVPALIEPALVEIVETLPGGRPDRARLDAMIALARAGAVAELASALAELLGVATAASEAGGVETAAKGGKRGSGKPISARLSALAARRTRDAGGRFADEGRASQLASPQPINRAASFRQRAEEALNDRDRQWWHPHGPLSRKAVERINKDARLDLGGYQVASHDNELRHAFKDHQDKVREAKFNQRPLVRDDFARLDALILAPDAARRSATRYRGFPAIELSKRFGSEELRAVFADVDGKAELRFVTMYMKV